MESTHASPDPRIRTLQQIASSVADAVEPIDVYEALVDRLATTLEASSAGLWTLEGDGRNASLVRSIGYTELTQRTFGSVDLATAAPFPALEALRKGTPFWIDSTAELLEQFPHLASVAGRGPYRVACLPLCVGGRTIGALGLTFGVENTTSPEERELLMLVARYAALALERLRLLREVGRRSLIADETRRLNEQNALARSRAEMLHALAGALISADRVDEVFDAALDAIERALGTDRASILALDQDGAMRFRAWRGLSPAYRAAVEGHAPWTRDTRLPRPRLVSDVANDVDLRPFVDVFRQEAIGALGFIPLIGGGRLVGMFVVYYSRPREISAQELEIAQAIANHVAIAIARFDAVAELENAVRFSEMFTGVLGHDLRTPLGAIVTGAQLALLRTRDDKLQRPLQGILRSGLRMARMIEQLLDFTRIRLGAGMPLDPRPSDLERLLRQVTDELEAAHPEGSLALEILGDTGGAWDEDRLAQVFTNLIANALQHGAIDGRVTIVIDGNESTTVRVCVHNAGIVPPELLPRLFLPLAGGERRSDGSQGLGLGLFITKQIVHAHGGRVEVESAEASGTSFIVALPRFSSAAARDRTDGDD